MKTNNKKPKSLLSIKPLLVSIYCLICPSSGLILYIGQSKHPQQRRNDLLKHNDGTYKSEVLRQIKTQLGMPFLHILEETTRRESDKRENYYIELAWRAGNPLLNVRVPKHVQTAYQQGNQRTRPVKVCLACRCRYPNTIEYFSTDKKQWDGMSAECIWCKPPAIPAGFSGSIFKVMCEQYLENKPPSM